MSHHTSLCHHHYHLSWHYHLHQHDKKFQHHLFSSVYFWKTLLWAVRHLHHSWPLLLVILHWKKWCWPMFSVRTLDIFSQKRLRILSSNLGCVSSILFEVGLCLRGNISSC